VTVRNSAAAFVVVLTLLAGTALAATPEQVVATKKASGGFALARVSATVVRPATLRVRVTSVPRQTVQVSWSVGCKKGAATTRRSRQYGPALTPSIRSVAFPTLRPDRCTLTATGQLEQEGEVVVALLARRR
jgi:hypothetical protein